MMTASSASDHFHQRRADGAGCLEQALRYLTTLRWSVLGLCPPDHLGVGRTHGKHCTSPGKAPWGLWKEFQERLPTEYEIRQKWTDNPTLNVGLALGPVSGLVRVDIDGPAGEARLLQVSGGTLPATLEFTSGRQNGGRGLLYKIPPGVVLRTTVERPGQPKQELRFQAKGAQTVLPPSRHLEGCLYAWVPGHSPWDIEAAVAPDWLLVQLRHGRRHGTQAAEPLADGEVIPEGSRDTVLTSMAGTMRRCGFSADAIFAALAVENDSRCEPPLEESQVRKIADSVGSYAPASAAKTSSHPKTVRAEVEV
jgi:putative DNA primase/helicase